MSYQLIVRLRGADEVADLNESEIVRLGDALNKEIARNSEEYEQLHVAVVTELSRRRPQVNDRE